MNYILVKNIYLEKNIFKPAIPEGMVLENSLFNKMMIRYQSPYRSP